MVYCSQNFIYFKLIFDHFFLEIVVWLSNAKILICSECWFQKPLCTVCLKSKLLSLSNSLDIIMDPNFTNSVGNNFYFVWLVIFLQPNKGLTFS